MLGGVLFLFEGCSEDIMYLFFFFPLDTLFLYIRSCDHFYDIHYTYFLFYDVGVCFFHLSLHVLFLIFVCNLLFLFHTKMP